MRFIVVGVQGFAQHETAKDLSGSKSALVAIFYPKAVLHNDLSGRIDHTRAKPRQMGDKLPRPCDVVKKSNQFFKSVVDWHGGKKREVELLSGKGNWCRIEKGLVKVRWLFVRDTTGAHLKIEKKGSGQSNLS